MTPLETAIAFHERRIQELQTKLAGPPPNPSKAKVWAAVLRRFISGHFKELNKLKESDPSMKLIDDFLEVQQSQELERIAALGPGFEDRYD